MIYRIAAAIPLVLLASQAFAQSQASLEQWVAANTPPEERIICTRDVNGEYFFIARAGPDQLRLGSRLDMTEYRGTHYFEIGWMLTNERGDFVVANIKPTQVRNEYAISGGKTYAENVEYQSIRLGTQELRVGVEIEKCPTGDCKTTESRAMVKKYAVDICTTRL